MTYIREIHRYAEGWSWSLSIKSGKSREIGSEIAGWCFTKWGARRAVKRAERHDKLISSSREVW